MSRTCLEATGLEKSFDGDRVLQGIDLTVRSGELLAVMGPNGVGKSVLFSCLAGSEHPTSGSVTVFDDPAADRSDTTSFLLQDALCLERLTGRENVRFYRQLHPAFTDDWREYAEALGLVDDLDKRVEHYSGGTKRKLELTIALSIDVPIYLLDEPTAALDLTVIQEVHRLLREKQAEGKTIVVSSHSPMDADIADRIAFVTGGRVAATGEPDELFDAVPPVFETTVTNADTLAAVAMGGRVFPSDGGVRAFAPPDDAASATDAEGVTRIERPTYTDLFNYYTTDFADANG
ncbi:ABC transporter ATP-binding protein [Halosolutus gelatinilyticus]|uniref:ABC transporter ATP-binding protein n=1 Tax=Halosolutus gelatinilyticus TaxID=2931975 RepID=UPI002AB1163B|nr:ABC transporter ATP-binding protein [Halosolutus gelatinilyticus]